MAERKPPPLQVAPYCAASLLLDLVDSITSLGFRGLDFEAVLLRLHPEEAPDAVHLPNRGRHDLAKGRSLGLSDKLQNLRPLAVAARRSPRLGVCQLDGRFFRLGFLPRSGCRDLPGARCVPAGATVFCLAPLFEVAFSGATVVPSCAKAAPSSGLGASLFALFGNPFCARSAHDHRSLLLPGNARQGNLRRIARQAFSGTQSEAHAS